MIGQVVIACSSCGEQFVQPGRQHGFSHCDDHVGVTTLDDVIDAEYGRDGR